MNRLRFFVIAKPSIRENVLLSLMSQSEKEYCLEMTNENARMRRILGRLSIAYASKQLLGTIKPIQSGKFGKPLVNGLSFSISHRIMSKILNSDNPTFIEKSRYEIV